jgi:hypothetical protein
MFHVHAVDEVMMMKARLMLASNPFRTTSRPAPWPCWSWTFFNRRRPDLEEQLSILTRHLEQLGYLLLYLRGEEEGFGEKIRWGREIHELLQLSPEALGNPFVSGRKMEEILRQKSNAIKPLEEMKWKGKEKERQEKFQKECEEAIYGGGGDYFGNPEKVKRLGTTDLRGGRGWTHAVVRPEGKGVPMGSEAPAGENKPMTEVVMVEGTAALEAGLGTREWPKEEERKLLEELRRQWIETSAQLREQGKETAGGVEPSELEEAFALAFGENGREPGEGERESGVGDKKKKSGVGSRESVQDALFRFLSDLYGGDPGFEGLDPVWTDPKLYQENMNDMQAVWGN